MTSMYLALRAWDRRHWLTALAMTAAGVLVVAVPTDLIDTPVFSREVPPTWWSWPALLASSALAGLLVATYVREPGSPDQAPEEESRTRWWGGAGGLLTFFAVGWLFLRFDGTAGITGVLGFGDTTDLEFEAQSWIAELSARDVDVWLLAAAAALLLGVIARRLHRLRNRTTDPRPDDGTIDAHDRQESR